MATGDDYKVVHFTGSSVSRQEVLVEFEKLAKEAVAAGFIPVGDIHFAPSSQSLNPPADYFCVAQSFVKDSVLTAVYVDDNGAE